MLTYCLRFGVGKKQMENICLEELRYMNEELRKSDGKPYDMSVRNYRLRVIIDTGL